VKWPDLGESLARHRPVVDLIAESLPITLLLNLITIPVVYGIGICSGILAARYRGRWFDVSSSLAFLALWSIPTIWAGVMLIRRSARHAGWGNVVPAHLGSLGL
jgi:peptide/nickel transport system permease protein